MTKFRFLNHTADVYIEAYGKDLKEAFENAALGMFEVIVNTGNVTASEELDISVEGSDLQSLLYNWLEELLYLFDAKGLVFSEFKVLRITIGEAVYRLEAKVRGEKFNPEKHEGRTAIKAVTYSLMEVQVKPEGVTLRFVLDI
ncbi:MAG: archease [Candidatus Nezhaarchaeales archaeon]